MENAIKMSNRISHSSMKISKRALLYFLTMMVMLRPTNPALQALFGSTLGELINVALKAGDYILIACVLVYAILFRLTSKNRVFTIQAWFTCVFLMVLIISTARNGSMASFRTYYEYLGNIFTILYLYQKARTDPHRFVTFLQGIAFFLTFSMLLNSLSIYIYYPNGMYVLDDGVSGNNNYYLYSLDNVGFIISLCSFAIHAVYDQILNKKIKRCTILLYIFIFAAYFYCRAATAILVTIILLAALILYKFGRLRGMDYKWTLIICIVSFAVIISIQSFSLFDSIFALLGKNTLLGGRLRIWDAAFKGWLDNLWIGIGIDSSVTSSILYQHGFVTNGWGEYIGHAHNIVFEILLKSGLIGSVCFIGQLFVCYKEMMQYHKSRIAQFLCLMFLLFWITSLLDYRIEQISGWILFMLLNDIKLLDCSVRGVGNEW